MESRPQNTAYLERGVFAEGSVRMRSPWSWADPHPIGLVSSWKETQGHRHQKKMARVDRDSEAWGAGDLGHHQELPGRPS